MKIVAYSLFGNDETYQIGAIKNAELIPRYYPGWKTRFYISDNIPFNIIDTLSALGSEIIHQGTEEGFRSTLWRFRAFEDKNVEYVISRDCDSRPMQREAEAVRDWMKSQRPFHIMRDHPWHQRFIMAGMCGGIGGILNYDELCLSVNGNYYGIDQDCLEAYLYPKISSNSMIHDSFFRYEFNSKKFPTKRINNEFVGESLNLNELNTLSQKEALSRIESSSYLKTKLALKTAIIGLTKEFYKKRRI